jgi:hypothetical protein
MSNSKEKKQEQRVIPVHNGKVQEECSLEQAVINLGNKQPKTWSIIKP